MSNNWIIPRTYSIVARLEALKARVISMQTANSKKDLSRERLTYTEEDFENISQEMLGLSRELDELGYV